MVSPCDDGVKLTGYSSCGQLSTGPYHLGVVPLQGLSSWHQCKGTEWMVVGVEWDVTFVRFSLCSGAIITRH